MSAAEKALFDGLMGDALRDLGREVPADGEALRLAFEAAVRGPGDAPDGDTLPPLSESLGGAGHE